MKRLKNFSLYLMLLITLVGLSSCDDRDYIEYHMPGVWYTSKPIDFGQYRLAIGTELYFDDYNGGYIRNGSQRISFRWKWYGDYSHTIELRFINGGPDAYIDQIDCGDSFLTGVWYNSYDDMVDRYDRQPFSMYRESY